MWWLFIDHEGRRKAKRVGNRKAAELAAIKIQARLAEGDATVLAPSASAAPTFAEYAEQWLPEAIAPRRKPRTEDYYRKILDHHLVPVFGTFLLSEIKPAQVRAFIAQRLTANAARNTVKNMVATLRAILYHAQQVDELIPSNPAARFGNFFDARHDVREHVVVLEPVRMSPASSRQPGSGMPITSWPSGCCFIPGCVRARCSAFAGRISIGSGI